MNNRRRSFLAAEVVQTSAMDCGPATLKALIEGFGISVSYGRLREACQIDLDGTSIDTVEQVAAAVGLEAEQVLVPIDHVLIDESKSLPAIVVVRSPDGLTHFVVAWRKHGPVVQVMDPATGRRWLSARRFLDELYVHRMVVPAAAWREFAGSAEFLGCLRSRLRRLSVSSAEIEHTIAESLRDDGWRAIAAVDACTRMVESLATARGVARGGESANLLRTLLRKSRSGHAESIVPAAYWSVTPAPEMSETEEQVVCRGALLVRVTGARQAIASDAESLSPELAAALVEPPVRPLRELLRLLTASGSIAPASILAALLVAGLGLVLEGLLFRSFFDLARALELSRQRAVALSGLVAILFVLLLLDLPIVSGVLRLGRHLEIRLRIAFLHKVPRLGDRYFQSRLTSDMAERSHSVERIRLAPDLGEWFTRTAAELLFTLGAIVWLDPAGAPVVVLAGAAALAIPVLFLPRIQELDLRVRNHAGALTRFHLDALLGLLPVKTHGAQRAVLRQHDGLLAEWSRSYLSLQRTQVITDAIVQTVMVSFTIALLFEHVGRKGVDGGVLLLVYWALKVLTLGHMLILSIATQYPSHRNVALRLLEPLGAPADNADSDHGATLSPHSEPHGVAIDWQGVSVRAAGHEILTDVSVSVASGQHIAIVGVSGAGKSSLVGTLLGWHRAATGSILVDGEPLTALQLQNLRHETAWIDPAVQLWNRPLLENLLYGSNNGGAATIDEVIRHAQLTTVLRQLPEGLQSTLGEGGGLISGGEGQRVRFARALLRHGVRLAVLDEPFRGLDREQRRQLLKCADEIWRDATLLCITHDVSETLHFERVLVIEGGRVVEDGDPRALAARSDSRYCALLDAEEQVRVGFWADTAWRRLHIDRGRVSEERGVA